MTPNEAAEIMAEVLDVDHVAPDQTFFELGGNSLLALKLIVMIRERVGAQLRLIDFIGSPTPVGISELVSLALDRDAVVRTHRA
jgi:acyl carrier protein